MTARLYKDDILFSFTLSTYKYLPSLYTRIHIIIKYIIMLKLQTSRRIKSYFIVHIQYINK